MVLARHVLGLMSLTGLFACSIGQRQIEPVDIDAATHAHLPFFDSAEFTPRWIDPAAIPADFHTIPAFTMHNQRGEVVTEAHADGKVTVVNFFFASCNGICPRLAESMATIDAAFPADADLVLMSYTVTPESDTVEVLANYAKTRNVDSERWHLLTGDRAETYRLGRQSYFIEESMGIDRTDEEFLHTENLVLLDGGRHVRGVYSGTNRAATAQLIADAKRLMAEE